MMTIVHNTCSLQGSQYWLGSYGANQKFFEELLSAASVSRPMVNTFCPTGSLIFMPPIVFSLTASQANWGVCQ